MRQELLHHLFAKKVDLASLKPNVDKLDINKIVPISSI